jgi:hypothetical protein
MGATKKNNIGHTQTTKYNKKLKATRRRKRSYEDCWEAIENNPFDIQYVPKKHQDLRMWKYVLQRNGRCIEFCKYPTQELIDIAFHQNHSIVQVLKHKFITEDLCIKTVTEPRQESPTASAWG